MTWVRLHDGFTDNAKIVALTDGELRVWLRLLCYCGRAQDPTVDDRTRHQVAGLTLKRLRRFIELRLLDAPESHSSNDPERTLPANVCEVHDWLKYQPKDVTNAERQARWRANNAVTKAVTLTVTESVTKSVTEPLQKTAPRPVPVTDLDSSTVAEGSNGAVVDDDEKQLFEDIVGDTDWTFTQCEGGRADPARAIAWIESAKTKPGLQARWGWAWKQFQGGGWPPEPARDINTSTVKYEHQCPHCPVATKGPRGLEEHIHVMHPELEEVPA